MSFKNKKKRQKGAVAILIAVVMLVVILFIAITVSSIIAVSQQSSSRLSDSIKAYQAADSGLEYGLKLFSDFMAVDPFINVMTLKDFLEYSDEFDDNYIEGNDSYNKRQFCSGNSTKWIVIDQIEFCLEPKADVLDNIIVMQATGRSGLTKRAVGVKLPVAETVTCYVKEGCADSGDDGVGLAAGTRCKLNRSLEGDSANTADYDLDYDFDYDGDGVYTPYPEDEICCGHLNDCDLINGGIDYGGCPSGDLICANKQSAFVIEGDWNNSDTDGISVNGGPSDDDFQTDKDHSIFIFTRGNARHNGVFTGNPTYRLEGPFTAGDCQTVKIRKGHVKIDGLQINTPNGIGCNGIYIEPYPGESIENVEISNNIIEGRNLDQTTGIFVNTLNSIDTKIWNNIIYDFNSIGGKGIRAEGINNIVYNNTIYNAMIGIQTFFDQTKIINNIVSTYLGPFSGIFNVASYNSWDNDPSDFKWPATTGMSTGNINATPGAPLNLLNLELEFQDPSNNNFLLDNAATAAQNNGLNLHPDGPDQGLNFDYDIQKDPRPSLPGAWDRGADED